jgi:hypothetical protein
LARSANKGRLDGFDIAVDDAFLMRVLNGFAG